MSREIIEQFPIGDSGSSKGFNVESDPVVKEPGHCCRDAAEASAALGANCSDDEAVDRSPVEEAQGLILETTGFGGETFEGAL